VILPEPEKMKPQRAMLAAKQGFDFWVNGHAQDLLEPRIHVGVLIRDI